MPRFRELTTGAPNNTVSCQEHGDFGINERYQIWYWVVVALFALIVLIGTILNSLVIYFAKHQKAGALRHLNTVVAHLAVSDLLYATLACPLLLHRFTMGKI